MTKTTDRWHLLLTCEHGGNRIPRSLAPLFSSLSARQALDSHRGWDPGALETARYLRRRMNAPLFHTIWSRLLVDTNRSPGHPDLFSEWTRILSAEGKRELVRSFYARHREPIESTVRAAALPIVHLAIHSFTPSLRGLQRNAQIGLLYDPGRAREKAFALRLREALECTQAEWMGACPLNAEQELAVSWGRVRRNYPYRGNADGLTTHLRKSVPDNRYLGLELELNQAFVSDRRLFLRQAQWLSRALESLMPAAPFRT